MGPVKPEFFTGEPMRAALGARDIGTAYRLLRRQGLSQRTIAHFTGQSQSEVGEILRGRRVSNVWVLAHIAEGLGIPRAWRGLSYGEQVRETPRGELHERDGTDDDPGQGHHKPRPSKGITRLTVSPPCPDDSAAHPESGPG